MKIHEYQARELLQGNGIPIVQGAIARDPQEALKIAGRLGYPVVLKAQVLSGGRGKAGGVKITHNPVELQEKFLQIKNLRIQGYWVEEILVVKAIDITREIYLGLTVDAAAGDVVLIASFEGGVDIEETAKTHPDKILKAYFQGKKELDPDQSLRIVKTLFEDPSLISLAQEILKKLSRLFFQYDCSLVEINPLVIDAQKTLYAADAKIVFDDNALFRHPEIEKLRNDKYEDIEEMEAKTNGLSFVKMEGNVGCIVNGAGLAMATMDIIKLYGGEPANFLDVGGSSNPQKVLTALGIILRNPQVKSILVNIFGGITRCDDIARGILEAGEKMSMPVPLVVRLTGTNEEEARALLAAGHVSTYLEMPKAVQEAVRLAKM